MNDNFAPAIARTVRQLNARHVGRAFTVAVPANSPARLCQSDLARVGVVFAVPSDAAPEVSQSPAGSLSLPVGGAGAVLLDCEAAPAADFSPSHEVHNGR